MRLEGIHHITAITGDAPGNVEFYVGVLGLRMVKKTVNQDDPTVYHLFYADEHGSPGADLTFFEYPGAAPGQAGAGMVHRIVWRVGSGAALDFWVSACASRAWRPSAPTAACGSPTPRASVTSSSSPRSTTSRSSAARPTSRASTRCRASTACARTRPTPAQRAAPARHARVHRRRGGTLGGARRAARRALCVRPGAGRPPASGAGTVHHIAFATTIEEHEAWQQRVARGGARPTPVIDRFYFRSVYFREPSGVLFELATIGPGFDADEDRATSASGSRCRRSSNRCARSSSRR